MPTAVLATAAAQLLADEEFVLVNVMFLSILAGILAFAAVCGYALWRNQPPKTGRRR